MDDLFGKYRGTVLNNLDPQGMGRIRAVVPDVDAELDWAMPCFPFPGAYAVPDIDSRVWIEFERGDPRHPIWTGCFYGIANDVPGAPTPGHFLTLESAHGTRITLTDLPGPQGGIVIRSATGATITLNETGIRLANGAGAVIDLTGPMVDINNGALSIV